MKNKIKLFCIPYAGGSANIYKNWKLGLAKNIELCPIELAGRGSRITESHYENLDAAVNDIFNQIVGDISKFDYAIFGHSLGAFLTYELIQKITLLGLKEPMHVFFSGRNPPHIPRKERWSQLSGAEFQEKILSLGGTPPEFFKYPELKNIFVPLLRSDFSLSETIINRPKITPLTIDISVLLGENEDIPPEIGTQWKQHTNKNCSIHYINGNHFFLLKEKEAVLDIINEKIYQHNLKAII